MSCARKGFTLLEVLVALAILGLALMAIFTLNSGAIANHRYTKHLTVATLLARSKMVDLEQALYDEGLPADDEEDAGDFSDEGWPSFKWRAKTLAPKTHGLSPQQLIGALFNLPLGEGTDLGGLASLFAGGAKDAKGSGPTQGPSAGALAALGPVAAMAQTQFTQMIDQLTKSVREVHLTVSWKDGSQTESIDFVTHVVSMGAGSERNGPSQAPVALQPGSPTMPDLSGLMKQLPGGLKLPGVGNLGGGGH